MTTYFLQWALEDQLAYYPYAEEFWTLQSEFPLSTMSQSHEPEVVVDPSEKEMIQDILGTKLYVLSSYSWVFWRKRNADQHHLVSLILLETLRVMLKKIGTLNFKYSFTASSGLNELTPTRQSMANVSDWQSCVQALQLLDIDLVDFAAAEAPLVDDGWTAETLSPLMKSKYILQLESIHCRMCPLTINWRSRDPLWDFYKGMMKDGVNVDASLAEPHLSTHL